MGETNTGPNGNDLAVTEFSVYIQHLQAVINDIAGREVLICK